MLERLKQGEVITFENAIYEIKVYRDFVTHCFIAKSNKKILVRESNNFEKFKKRLNSIKNNIEGGEFWESEDACM